MMTLTVLKLGGELFEAAPARERMADLIAALPGPLIVVHGGGKAIDAELQRRGIQPKKVDGLRITDAETLDAVIAVLAGSANTSLVAALVARGVKAVGLTGVDAGAGRAAHAAPLQSTSGALVDLGLVGDPTDADPALFRTLVNAGYVPVVACLGVDDAGQVLNVNADVMACRIAAAMGGPVELVIAGTTPGVFDAAGATIPALDVDGMDALIRSGAANAGMVAKLNACRAALDAGVSAVKIVDGQDLKTGTTLVAGVRA
ncbi:MAG: acetylglutamate kinase [Acidobacteria bacterium]|nr:MAG: acetylglutamate kinase [Acidobacteriota bacterium]